MFNFWKSARRWLPGVFISLVAIAAILYFVDLQRFVDAIRSANYWLLLTGFASSFIWLAVRAIVWRTILRERASYKDVFLTLCEGYLLNNFLPFRLGEIGRAFLLGRKSKLGFMEVLPTIIIERILDLAFAAVILLSAVPFVVGAAGAGKIAIIIGGVMVVGLVVLYVLASNRNWALSLFRRLSARWPALQKRGGDFLFSLFLGLSILTDGWLFLRVLLWMTLDWVISILQFHILILAFFPQATLIWSLFGLGAVAFGNAIPSLPGAVGTFEGAFGGAITLLSGDQSTALAAALTAHLFNYLSTGIIGLYALSSEGETLMGIYRQLRKRQVSLRESPSGADETIPDSSREIDSVASHSPLDTDKKE
ncbi:MAG TPA: lysylphosphatidylglycerol synthase transmembrane domain-containing protein [Anaerolineales bacterium]